MEFNTHKDYMHLATADAADDVVRSSLQISTAKSEELSKDKFKDKKKKIEKELPIIIGERIGETHLYKRFQGDREVSPIYIKDKKETYNQAEINAQNEADSCGLKSVTVGDMTFVKFSFVDYWCVFNLHLNKIER